MNDRRGRIRRLLSAGAAGVWVLGGTPCVLAQDSDAAPALEDPSSDPALTDDALRSEIDRLGRETEPGTRVAPVRGEPVEQARPGVLDELLFGEEAGARLIGEGAFIPEARGRLVTLSDGRIAMVFDQPEAVGASSEATDPATPGVSKGLPPMVLVANRHRDAMERIWARADGGVRLVVSGRVLVYHDTNYLLVTGAPRVERPRGVTDGAGSDETGDAGAPTQPDAGRGSSGEASPGEVQDPEIAGMIERLENSAGPSRIATRETSEGAAPVETIENDGLRPAGGIPLREGEFVASRRGRIVRSMGGELVAVFDNGIGAPGAPGGRGPTPMVLAPNQNLERLERLAERGGSSLDFTLSGEVLAYRGRNHLLVTMFQVRRQGKDLTPLQ